MSDFLGNNYSSVPCGCGQAIRPDNSTCGIERILQLTEAINTLNIILTNSKEESLNESSLWSYSTDGVCFTDWLGWDDLFRSLKSYNGDFYLRIKFRSDIGLLTVNGLSYSCYNVYLSNNTILENPCNNSNLYSPYSGLECAIALNQQLTDSVSCLVGIPIYYFKVLPDKNSADYTFKEYFLHAVDSVKQIKMIIQDGELPDARPQLTDFELGWDYNWDVEISKTVFANAFGDTAFPAERDFIYVPLQKRMYQVNTAYENKQFMWQATTWKLALTKYSNKDNIDLGDSEGLINELIVNKYDDYFGKEEEKEQEATGVTQIQSPKYAAQNIEELYMYDAVRKSVTKNAVRIIDNDIYSNNLLVAKNLYQFNSFDKNAEIEYQKKYCGGEGTLSFILQPGMLQNNSIFSLGHFSILLNNQTIEINNLENTGLTGRMEQDKTYLVVIRWSKKLFKCNLDIYKLSHKEGIPLYRLRPEMWYFDFEEPIVHTECLWTDEWTIYEEVPVKVTYFDGRITNIKLFNVYMNSDEYKSEVLKYITTNEACLISDCAKPFISGSGYSVQ